MDLPICSVVIPCRNEIRFIEACLRSLLGNDYPVDRLEIIAVDGGSTDGTRDVLARYAAEHAHLTMLDNPGGVIPVSMNLGIRHARGSAILKADAHALYPPEYIRTCVRGLVESGADNVGGVIEPCAADDSVVGRAIARVLVHPFGSGNAQFRVGSPVAVETDTVAFGCYRRDTLDRVGGYNEALVRSSDMDLNNRIRRGGGRILLVPGIACRYYPLGHLLGTTEGRSVFALFVRRNWGYGFWATYPLKFGGEVLRPRHLAPLAALLVLVLLGSLAFFAPLAGWAVAGLLSLYAAMTLVASVQVGMRERNVPVAIVAPAVFMGWHGGYAVGSLWGLLRVLASREFWRRSSPGGVRVPRRASRPHPARPTDRAWQAPFRESGAVSIVIPAFNEERRLPSAIDAIERYLGSRGIGYEIVVVDDGSTDRTPEVVASLAANRRHLRLIRLPVNQGKGAAVRAGMLAASGRWLVFTDADQSTSMDQLPLLMEPLVDGFDVAVASRGLPGSTFLARQRWYRRALGRAFGVLTKGLLVRGFRDCQCGFKAFSREATREIFGRLTSPTAIFDMEVMLLSARLGLRVAEVPVEWRHDPDSRLVYNVPRALALVRELLRLRRQWSVVVAERAAVTPWTSEGAAGPTPAVSWLAPGPQPSRSNLT